MSNEQPRTRQEIYDRIRETSKTEYILEEMIRLGFWPESEGLPDDPAEAIRRQGELQRQIREKYAEVQALGDTQKQMAQLRKERMAASRRQQQETKARRLKERADKAQAWTERQQREVVYLGAEVSAGLNHSGSQSEVLSQAKLPLLHTPLELAQLLEIPLSELRFLAYDRKVSQVRHYIDFALPKKTGGTRLISAPMPRLKQVQHLILRQILRQVSAHPAAQGFEVGTSILSNATPHIGQHLVINLDLKDFFPSIGYRRVKGLFRKLGYAEAVAIPLALLTTAPVTQAVELDGQIYHIAVSERRLPQGSPASPEISNLICLHLDRRLSGLAHKYGFQYTRYADDLTFSAASSPPVNLQHFLAWIHRIVAEEGFTVHPQKTRLMHRGRRQEVTGIIVNDKPGVDRKTLKKFRALLHQIERDGPEGKKWGAGRNLWASIEGYAQFVAQIKPEQGRRFLSQVRGLKQQYQPLMTQPEQPVVPHKKASTAESSSDIQRWW